MRIMRTIAPPLRPGDPVTHTPTGIQGIVDCTVNVGPKRVIMRYRKRVHAALYFTERVGDSPKNFTRREDAPVRIMRSR